MLTFAAFLPHPPIIIPTIGSPLDLQKVSKTLKSIEKITEIFGQTHSETVIIVSPHAPLFPDAFSLNLSPTFVGRFLNFGDFSTELMYKNDLNLANSILEATNSTNIPIRTIQSNELDHGTLVPLYFLSQTQPSINLVSLGFSFLSRVTHYNFGKLLQKVILKENKKIAFVASGDLSHRLTKEAPAGFSPKGKEFDEKIVKLLQEKNVQGILNFDENLAEEAGECGYRSLLILLGILDSINWKPEILSYEGPFGVGYLVANFSINT